ncbi:MAG: (4Fe-4S)-binding protein [candidate division Zixibacteria bacterium HGW-Zixibacteria-1]|nr:MAG: (4Fe-4S)-binding protein [candidate division Zixibacteria bacterium HGW-Zixibacteria-1]
MELVILSGKGGTGKTSLVASLAALAEKKILVDCDVDAADLHLILDARFGMPQEFRGGSRASIDQEKCMVCGICTEYCRFGAIRNAPDVKARFGEKFWIDEFTCEGCGVCTYFCPEKAIDLNENISGQWYISETRYGLMVHARLGIAQANSGRLVSHLRREASRIAEHNDIGLVIIDGPPGIGCPVIASMTGTDYVLIITEPSMSAFHDMERLVRLTRHFRIPVGVCINKFDINSNISAEIEEYANREGIDVLGMIPYDVSFTRAQLGGVSIMEYSDNNASEQIRKIWERLQSKTLSGKKSAPMPENKLIKLE